MISEHPYISVIVPFYNSQDTLKDCLRSLIEQNYPKDRYEIIAVDNNSTDQSAQITKGFPNVRLLHENKTQSSYAARNLGIQEARGRFIAFTDADCIAQKDWLKELVNSFDRDPSMAGVSGETQPFSPQTLIERYQAQHAFPSRYLSMPERDSIPHTCNVMYRTSIIRSFEGFNSSMTTGGDADLAFRILKQGHPISLNTNAIIFHKHRSTLAGLWEQFHRYGKAHRTLKMMGYDLSYKKLRIESFCLYALIGLPYAVLTTFLGLIKVIFQQKPAYTLAFPTLQYIEGLALRKGIHSC